MTMMTKMMIMMTFRIAAKEAPESWSWVEKVNDNDYNDTDDDNDDDNDDNDDDNDDCREV